MDRPLIAPVYDIAPAAPAPAIETGRTFRTRSEIVAGVLAILAALVVPVLVAPTMNAHQLTIEQRHIVVIQLMIISWIIFLPSAYYWHRAGGLGRVGGFIWLLVALALPVAILVCALNGTVDLAHAWSNLTQPIPFHAIF